MQITIKNISKSYGKKKILNGVSFSADSGKCIGILGSNGSGKSTLLSILAGIQKCDSGSFLYNGNDLFNCEQERSRLVGYVPQGTPLFEELSAKDNLLLWYSKKELETKLKSGVLNILGINEMLKTTVSKMSGGMKKRLSIGCSISKNPPILLLDEPMAALDLSCKQKILEYLETHKQNGGIILIATHDVLELDLCDEFYIFKNGTLLPYDYNGDINELVKQLWI